MEPGFLCFSGTILDLVQLCDGKADCEGGDDETHPLCASKHVIIVVLLHHDIIIYSAYIVTCLYSIIIRTLYSCQSISCYTDKCLFPYYGGCFHTRECHSTAREATCGLCRPGFARDSRNYETGECIGMCLMMWFKLVTRCMYNSRNLICGFANNASFSSYI